MKSPAASRGRNPPPSARPLPITRPIAAKGNPAPAKYPKKIDTLFNPLNPPPARPPYGNIPKIRELNKGVVLRAGENTRLVGTALQVPAELNQGVAEPADDMEPVQDMLRLRQVLFDGLVGVDPSATTTSAPCLQAGPWSLKNLSRRRFCSFRRASPGRVPSPRRRGPS